MLAAFRLTIVNIAGVGITRHPVYKGSGPSFPCWWYYRHPGPRISMDSSFANRPSLRTDIMELDAYDCVLCKCCKRIIVKAFQFSAVSTSSWTCYGIYDLTCSYKTRLIMYIVNTVLQLGSNRECMLRLAVSGYKFGNAQGWWVRYVTFNFRRLPFRAIFLW